MVPFSFMKSSNLSLSHHSEWPATLSPATDIAHVNSSPVHKNRVKEGEKHTSITRLICWKPVLCVNWVYGPPRTVVPNDEFCLSGSVLKAAPDIPAVSSGVGGESQVVSSWAAGLNEPHKIGCLWSKLPFFNCYNYRAWFPATCSTKSNSKRCRMIFFPQNSKEKKKMHARSFVLPSVDKQIW